MPDIEFPTSAGTAPGYLAVPTSKSGPATIVLQEWWGLDDHIRSVCDRLVTEGFFALAPDLYRGESTAQPSEAEQKMMALSMDQAEQDMRGAVEFLASQPGVQGPGVGAVGFCLGGGLSLWAAATCPQIAAAVTYYYVMPHGKPDEDQMPRPRALRDRRCVRLTQRSQGPGNRAAHRRRQRHLRQMHGRRARLLQRHQPPQHVRPRRRAALLGTNPHLPTRGVGRN
jgi:dienelactone hydrolase